MQLNSAFYNANTAYIRRRQAAVLFEQFVRIPRSVVLSALHGVPVLDEAWVEPVLGGIVVVPEEWRENVQMSRLALINHSERLHQYVELATK